jgi:DNA modification methylase
MNPKVDILVGDCREQMKTLPDNSVHCVVTSPPYWGLRDYGVDGQIGLEKSVDEFLSVMVEVFREVRRVLRPDGTCWMNLGDTYTSGGRKLYDADTGRKNGNCNHSDRPPTPMGLKPKDLIGIPWRTALALQADGWWLRQDIIWHKPNPVPEPDRGRCTVAHEYMFLMTKSERYFWDNDAIRERSGDEPDWEEYTARLGSNTGCDSHRWSRGYKKMSHELTHPNGRQKRSVWTIPTKGFSGTHFATFPPALVEPCIKAGTSEKGCCSQCGAPRKRVTEVTPEYQEKLGKSWNDHEADRMVGQRGVPSTFRGAPARITKGWEATCSCGADFIPCTVLDPFGGSGTTGEVALQLGRSTILIELNPEYVKFIEQRTSQLRIGLTG